MQVRSLGQEDPLEEEVATHSSILAWRIPWTEEPGGLGPQGQEELDKTEHTHTFFFPQASDEIDIYSQMYTFRFYC